MNYFQKKLSNILHTTLNLAVVISMTGAPFAVPTAHADSSSTCSVSATVDAGDTVEWTANLAGSGGIISFDWSGDESLSGDTQTVSKTYTTAGEKNASASVVAVGNNVSTACLGISFSITPNPIPNTRPVITLEGNNPLILTAGDTYVDPGFSAFDNEDEDISNQVILDTSNLNLNEQGLYTVTYNVTDSQGLAATEVTREVAVNPAPNEAPVITLIGANPQQIYITHPYVELGATATDDKDVNITDNIVIDASSVNTNLFGSYFVRYSVTDSEGLPATEVIREVVVSDIPNTRPVITLEGNNPLILTAGDTYVDPGFSAFDNEDGDVKDKVVVDISSLELNNPGQYVITYNVADSQGLTADEEIRIVLVNPAPNEAPVITLIGANPQQIYITHPYVELGATATDDKDVNITDNIVIDASSVNTNLFGSYFVRYSVTDSEGLPATEVIREVVVSDIPTESAVCSLTTSVAAGQTVTWSTPEVPYIVTYSWTGDDSVTGNTHSVSHTYTENGDVEATVTVTGLQGQALCDISATLNTPPVITLIGEALIQLFVGDTYDDEGATAFDNEDKDITADIVEVSDVDTATAGDYTVTYNVTDSEGLAATEVTRSVSVIENICELPEITSALTASAMINESFTYTIMANNADSATYSVEGLPAGLSFDENTAMIYGTPDAVGLFDIELTAQTDCGVDSETLSLTVNSSGGSGNNAPEITLVGDNPQEITKGFDYNELGATATDLEDGDIDEINIVIDASSVNTDEVGSYGVTYNVVDSEGLAAVTQTRTVNVVEGELCTVPELLSETNLNLDKGQNVSYTIEYTPDSGVTISLDDSILPLGLSFIDDSNGGYTIEGDLDSSAEGTYIVPVVLLNECGEVTADISITVVSGGSGGGGGGRGGNRAPIITLNDNNPQTVSVGSNYIELGAIALDREDGDITSDIVIDDSNIDTNTIGSYSVTYNVKDSHKRAAEEKVRVVEVVAGGGGTPTPETPEEEPQVCHYLRDFLRIDFDNDSEEIIKLQSYLNSFEGETLEVNGIFDDETDAAVKRYQDKYADEILNPWGDEDSTGYVYITTQRHINETYCERAFPLSDLEQGEIDEYRSLLEGLEESGISDGGLIEPTDVGNTEEDFVSDGVIGLNTETDTDTDVDNVIEVTPEATPETEESVDRENNEVLGNLATILFATPEGFNETATCVGWFAIILIAVYIIGTLIVNGLSRTDNISSRIMRMRKVAVYIIGLVYAMIPALLTESHCLILPILIFIAFLSLAFIYLWIRERKTRRVLGF